MNDPHVVALLYRIKHARSVDYSAAEPLEREEEAFTVHVRHEEVRFEMKHHYSSTNDAREALDEYIRAWEFEAGLRYGPDAFGLEFRKPEIEDRKPTPGVISPDVLDVAVAVEGHLTIGYSAYPAPPSTIKVTDDARSMYDRFVRSLAGNEPLASMAYFCLTVLKASVDQPSQKRRRRRDKKRPTAADKYRIEERILSEISRLSSVKGGADARKANGTGSDFTAEDRRFLTEAVKKIIYRMAEAACGSETLSTIRLCDLPPLASGKEA